MKKTLKKTNPATIANVGAVLITVARVLCCVALCGGSTESAIKSIIDTICTIFAYVGAGILVLGVAKFALALKDENGPGQSQAILYAIAGGVLIGIKVIVDNLDLGI